MRQLSFFVLLMLLKLTASSQFTVTNSNSATALAQKIIGNGVTILNPVFKGPAVSAGFFVDKTGVLGLDSGILLTSGRAQTINTSLSGIGANGKSSLQASYSSNAVSDSDLDFIVGSASLIKKDACVLEFDFIPQGDSINVKFVFASEEYPEYACTEYNDVFAFLISGPGFATKTNIALIPGTNIPVAINSINSGAGENGGDIQNCTDLGAGSPFSALYVNNKGAEITYDAFTKVLTAKAGVIPCQVYHIKLAIEDVGDDTYDSGVFLQASSFSSNGVSLTNVGGLLDENNNTVVVEGCMGSQVKIQLNEAPSLPLTLPLTYSGTATFGVDYAALPTSITFGVGETTKFMNVTPILDALTEPTETIVIAIGGNVCNNAPTSIVNVLLKDSIQLHSAVDTLVCLQNLPVQLTGNYYPNSINTYQWNNGPTTQQTIAGSLGSYFITHSFGARCSRIDTFHVINANPVFNIGKDTSICANGGMPIVAGTTVAGSYLWNNGQTTQNISITVPGTYWLQLTNSRACTAKDTIEIGKLSLSIYLGKDTVFCTGRPVSIGTNLQGSYLWSNGSNSQYIAIGTSGDYWLKYTNQYGCFTYDTIAVSNGDPIFSLGKDTFFCSVANIPVHVGTDTMGSYLWSTNATQPFIDVSNAGNYWLKLTNNYGCALTDTISIVNGDLLLDLGPDVYFCERDSIAIGPLIPLAGSFLWNTGETVASIYSSNTSDHKLKYTSANGCYVFDEIRTIMKPLAYPPFAKQAFHCSYDSVTLNAYYPGATYSWNTNETTASINVLRDGQYFVVSTLDGCSVKDSVMLISKAMPIADAGKDFEIFLGNIARLQAMTNANNAQYLWQPNTLLDFPFSYNPAARNLRETQLFQLKVTSVDNCVAYDTVLVTVKDPPLVIPNVFSPNGDNINDKWEINLLKLYTFARVQIFDRAGQLIYSSTGYEKPWDGTFKGKPLPVATYYYIIEPKPEKPAIRRAGYVTILR